MKKKVNLTKYFECCRDGHKFDGIPTEAEQKKGKSKFSTSYCTHCKLDHPLYGMPDIYWWMKDMGINEKIPTKGSFGLQ